MADLPTTQYDQRVRGWGLIAVGLAGAALAIAIALGRYEMKEPSLIGLLFFAVGSPLLARSGWRVVRGKR